MGHRPPCSRTAWLGSLWMEPPAPPLYGAEPHHLWVPALPPPQCQLMGPPPNRPPFSPPHRTSSPPSPSLRCRNSTWGPTPPWTPLPDCVGTPPQVWMGLFGGGVPNIPFNPFAPPSPQDPPRAAAPPPRWTPSGWCCAQCRSAPLWPQCSAEFRLWGGGKRVGGGGGCISVPPPLRNKPQRNLEALSPFNWGGGAAGGAPPGGNNGTESPMGSSPKMGGGGRGVSEGGGV